MKLIITEKQLKHLVSKIASQEIDEVEDTPTSTPESEAGVEEPTSGTSGGQEPEATDGYPDVHKWDSGATRGPGNTLGNTKWPSANQQPKRDKANTLN